MFLQVGIQHKPDDLNMKTTNLVLVNVLNDQVCNDILKISWYSTRNLGTLTLN